MDSPTKQQSASITRKLLTYLWPFSSSSSSLKSDRLFQLSSADKTSPAFSRFAWTVTIRINRRTIFNSLKWTLIFSGSVVASYYLFRAVIRQLNGKAAHPGYDFITDRLPAVDPLEMAVDQMKHAGHPTLRYERNNELKDDTDDTVVRPTDEAIERIDAVLGDRNSHSKLVKGDESLNPSSFMPLHAPKQIPDGVHVVISDRQKPATVTTIGDEDVVVLPALPAKLEQLLQSPHVVVKFPQRVRVVIESMIADGADRLQVIADFDRTLTRAHRDGKPCATTHSVIDSTSLLPKWFHQQCLALRDFYYAKEIDETLSDQVKSEFMLEWWTKAHELLLKVGLTHGMIEQMVRESNAHLRDNSQAFFDILKQHHVPLLVFSAGIGTIIREILRQKGVWDEKHMAVVANELVFAEQTDERGELPLIRFKAEQVIHSFNKERIFDEHRDYFDSKKDRVNVILMGDMMGDLKMAQGVHNVQNILTIGFLNDKVDTRLDAYTSGYDVVLKDDQTLTFPIRLVEAILNSGRSSKTGNGSISSPVSATQPPPSGFVDNKKNDNHQHLD